MGKLNQTPQSSSLEGQESVTHTCWQKAEISTIQTWGLLGAGQAALGSLFYTYSRAYLFLSVFRILAR